MLAVMTKITSTRVSVVLKSGHGAHVENCTTLTRVSRNVVLSLPES